MVNHPKVYNESIWNPVTYEQALNPALTYLASKKLAEKAAWDFMEQEKPQFSLTTMCPPLIFGPIRHLEQVTSANINTSNGRILNLLQGNDKTTIPPTGLFLWVDVRDVAYAHVRALEVPEAAGQRFFVTAGYYDNAQIVEIIRGNFPGLASILPTGDFSSDLPEDVYGFDNSKSVNVLGLRYRSFESCVIDTVNSFRIPESRA